MLTSWFCTLLIFALLSVNPVPGDEVLYAQGVLTGVIAIH